MAQLVTATPYRANVGQGAGNKSQVLLQAYPGTGTVTFQVKVDGAPNFQTVKVLTATPEIVEVPTVGQYQVVLTGTATCFGDFS